MTTSASNPCGTPPGRSPRPSGRCH
ncbi:hypothetical protein E2C01_066771 [Portunus trituberculatus]|uniref:Uncharacterized protein n=1 Tax=Portunus trituberculatus TaxID=210409 RepID=A0A5B7HQQ1_PORTR|nr:hypothetical protein [Portunus trituberculatus]